MSNRIKLTLSPEADNSLSKRLGLLLKRTETFSNFVDNLRPENPIKRPKGVKRRFEEVDKENSSSKSHAAINSEGSQQKKIVPFRFQTSPDYIMNSKMRDYQVVGLNWMISLYENGMNGILADEMGLGKTLQTISLLGYLKHYKNISGPHIIVVPKSTITNWMNEIERFCPSLKAVCFTGSKRERLDFLHRVFKKGSWDICVTSYETCRLEQLKLQKVKWCYLVVDEINILKNVNTNLAKVTRQLDSKHRLILTGTPIQNNLRELWALMNFLLPSIFNSAEDFDAWFNNDEFYEDDTILQRLQAVLKPFILRRLKLEIEPSLLPKKEINIYVTMTDMQREWYKKLLQRQLQVLKGDGNLSYINLNNIFVHLRKCVNHPYLFNGAEPGPPYSVGDHMVYNAGKMIVLDKLLTKLREVGSRVLIFSQFTTMLDILDDYCFWKEYKYCRLDGQTTLANRQSRINEFNKDGSDIFIFMLSTRAGGLGINLATADVVIIYDSDWNPQMDLQAMDRAHRIGQKKQVRVFRFVTENTVEDRMIELSDAKRELEKRVIQKDFSQDSKVIRLDRDTLLDMIRFGADDILASKTSKIKKQTNIELMFSGLNNVCIKEE